MVASAEQHREEPVTVTEGIQKAKCCYNRPALLTVLIQIPVDAGSGGFPEQQRTMSHLQVFLFESAAFFFFF